MRVGVGFFVTSYTIDPVAIGTAVEGAGFESLWVPDHPVFPASPVTPNPLDENGVYPRAFGEIPEPLITLSFIASATTELKLGTGVILATERHPLILAKSVATLDRFSNGRTILGVGTGNLPEDVAMYGVEFGQRWRYVEETVGALKSLWSQDSAGFDGNLVNFPAVRCDPLPVQEGGPPVLIGAPGSDLTLTRIAKWADGWLVPKGLAPAQLRAAKGRLDEKCRELGRDPSEIEITVFSAMDATPAIQREYEDAGASRLVVQLYNHPSQPLEREQWEVERIATLGGQTDHRPSASETLHALEWLAERAQL